LATSPHHRIFTTLNNKNKQNIMTQEQRLQEAKILFRQLLKLDSWDRHDIESSYEITVQYFTEQYPDHDWEAEFESWGLEMEVVESV
jgi:hypothetical protein